MARSRPLVFLFASALLAGTDARARPPPPSRADQIRRDNRAEVWDSLKGCSAEATSRHEYHVIEVEFPYSLGEEFSPRIKSSRSLDRKQYWCVARALRALRLEPIPRNDPFNSYNEVHDYALGQVQPLLPAALLPAWQRASNDPDRVRRELASMLPPEVKVGRDGCLRLQGPPLLAPALDAWLRQAAGPPILDSGRGFVRAEQDHPLPGDWWIRHRLAFDDDSDRVANDTVCLEKLDSAAGTLRRHRKQLWDAVLWRVLEAEWVVDAQGAIAGEMGLCLQPEDTREYRSVEPEELGKVRRDLEGALRGVSFGPAPGLRRVILGWGPGDQLITSVRPAREPLTRSTSAIEAHCEQRQHLSCTRMGGGPEHHSGTALRGCLDASHLNEAIVDVTFDISPDGAVENLAPLLWMEGAPVTGQAQACLAAVFRLIRYPPSDGGPCRLRRRLETFLAP